MDTINYFLNSSDERDLSDELVVAFPALRFIDGTHWPTRTPPVFESIPACSGSTIPLWWSNLVSALPTRQEADGTFRGPSTTYVLQMIRCSQRDGQLQMAQIRTEANTYIEVLRSPVRSVLKIMRKRYRCDSVLIQPGGSLVRSHKNYLIGQGAAMDAKCGIKLVPSFGAESHFLRKEEAEQASPANRHPCGTSVMPPADPASRAGATPEASGDS